MWRSLVAATGDTTKPSILSPEKCENVNYGPAGVHVFANAVYSYAFLSITTQSVAPTNNQSIMSMNMAPVSRSDFKNMKRVLIKADTSVVTHSDGTA